MTALTEAYREYLERMIEQSHDLLVFDQFTVPLELDPQSPALSEFGDFE